MLFTQMLRSRSSSIFQTVKQSILAIETSFDNTAAAVMTCEGRVLSNQIFDQVRFHNQVGGTDPRFAKNLHSRHLPDS